MIIWLSSYPRSGNTFLRTLLKNCMEKDTYSIYNDNDIGGDLGLAAITGHRTLEHRFGSPKFDISQQRKSNEVIFLKTHEINQDLVEPEDKVIYIIRDGRQATLSFYKYLCNFSNREISLLAIILGFEFPGGSWNDHVSEWHPMDSANTLLLYFEEVITNPRETVRELSKFSSTSIKRNLILSFDELHQLNPLFFRQGKQNSFKDELPEEAQILFLIKSYREMCDYGYTNSLPSFVKDQTEETMINATEGVQKMLSYLHQKMKFLKSGHILIQQSKNNQVANLMKLNAQKEQHIETLLEQLHKKDLHIKILRELLEKDKLFKKQRNDPNSGRT